MWDILGLLIFFIVNFKHVLSKSMIVWLMYIFYAGIITLDAVKYAHYLGIIIETLYILYSL